MQAKDRLIFALDVDSTEGAVSLVELLAEEVGVFKIGLELFVSQGPSVVKAVCQAGAKAVFLDLKVHDIPATMQNAVKQAARLGADFITCHADQADIFTGMDFGEVGLLGITVLTSLDAADLKAMGYPKELCDPAALVAHRAKLAIKAGCNGVVCSGHEASAMRALLGPEAWVVCPGIRLEDAEASADDQKRVMTPEKAMRGGASHIVVGRPIRTAQDPAAAARQVVESMVRGLA